MSITVKPYLLKRRKKSNGLIPVYLRITQNGKYSLLSTGIDVKASHWDKKAEHGKWIKKGNPSAKALNLKIENKINEIKNTINQAGDNVGRKQIVKQVKGNKNNEFYEFAESFYNRLQAEDKLHPYKQTKAAVSKFRQFAGSQVRFNDITPAKLNEFQKWMKSELDNHPNTIVKTIGRIKAILKDAYEKDLMTSLPFNDPKFKQVKTVESKKQALSIEQIDAIENLKLEPGSSLWHTRNYFMFSFWNAGIRFTDLTFLKWENIVDGRLIYQMGKTSNQKNIKLLPQSLEILSHYETNNPKDFIFPILPKQKMTELGYKKKAASKNVIENRNLKKIAEKAGIQMNVSFHISRHSFARWADNSDAMDRGTIMNALAHSKMATTERYLDSFSEYRLDEGMQKLAETRNGKK